MTQVEGRLIDEIPRNDERLDLVLCLGLRVEERRSLRCAEPLVAVAGVDVGAEPVDQRREAPLEREELDRLALQFALEALVRLEDGPRARAERPVVEIDDRGIEEEKFLHSA